MQEGELGSNSREPIWEFYSIWLSSFYAQALVLNVLASCIFVLCPLLVLFHLLASAGRPLKAQSNLVSSLTSFPKMHLVLLHPFWSWALNSPAYLNPGWANPFSWIKLVPLQLLGVSAVGSLTHCMTVGTPHFLAFNDSKSTPQAQPSQLNSRSL